MKDRAKILVVDDDENSRKAIIDVLGLQGYILFEACDGEQALEAVKTNQPDVLLLDVRMPVMDGFAVLEKYPKEERPFPVIMLTNFGDDKNKARGEELGSDDYFIKSQMTMRKLLEMVENLMKAKKYWNK